ncbi:hypothetical protein KJ359_005454 [Pestalotiopsis sp. 9143b]|nr:hypothetical protein KJ359_005454 [Pestalotiopsis sp. 9143b]
MIPKTSFNSQADFDADWDYLYPWGSDHNGGARMAKSQVSFGSGQLTLTAHKVSGQPDASHGGKAIPIHYLSGAVHAREHFNVSKGGGYDFAGELKATTTKGTWPAFWLTAVDGWPPEIDMAEWKGSGKISFNTFNTSSVLSWKDVTYSNPGDWHAIKCELRDINQKDVQVKFYMDGVLQATQVGGGFFGKPMYLSSAARLLLSSTVRAPPPNALTTPLPPLIAHRIASKLQPRTMSVSTAAEAEIKRNPHPDFKQVEGSRPDWDTSASFRYTKTADPEWKFGGGANKLHDGANTKHVTIDPYEPGRPAPFNYKLLISSIVPRPIGFVSTTSPDGTASNLAPFSYFNMVNHDPPLFVLGFASGVERPKDTLKNLLESKECVVNIISEGFVEAANATSVDAPYGASEWDVSGLTPVKDCRDVKAARVSEAVFSVECRLESVREFESRATPGKKTGCLVVVEGTNFWVREDAVNEERNLVDPAILRPISRLGGITYGRLTEAMEIPRPVFEKDVGGQEGYEKLKKDQQ